MAFDPAVSEDVFPPFSCSVYASLSKSLSEQLKTLYKHVEIPIAAPWRSDFASVYFIVSDPLKEIAHASLAPVLGAKHDKVATPGSQASLFAVPIANVAGKFYKVAVHECQSKAELACATFYLSYGDLGMILSLFARSHGLVFGTKGLKTHYAEPNDMRISGYVLSESPEEIMQFFGLSADAWKRGFKSQDQVFTWLKKSKFFNAPQLVVVDAKSRKKGDRQLREMYYSFIRVTAAEKQAGSPIDVDGVREHALKVFRKKATYDEVVKKNRLDRARREKLNGKQVMEWTNLYGPIVSKVMAVVRARVGEQGLIELDTEALKKEVLEVAKDKAALEKC